MSRVCTEKAKKENKTNKQYKTVKRKTKQV